MRSKLIIQNTKKNKTYPSMYDLSAKNSFNDLIDSTLEKSENDIMYWFVMCWCSKMILQRKERKLKKKIGKKKKKNFDDVGWMSFALSFSQSKGEKKNFSLKGKERKEYSNKKKKNYLYTLNTSTLSAHSSTHSLPFLYTLYIQAQ